MFVSYSLNPGNSTGRSDASRCFFLYVRHQTGKKSIQPKERDHSFWIQLTNLQFGHGNKIIVIMAVNIVKTHKMGKAMRY